MTTLRDAAYNPAVPPPTLSDEPGRSARAVSRLPLGQAFTLTVRGGSMEPTLRSGEAVRVRRASFGWPGDIAVVRSGSSVVVHRVLGYRPHRGGWAFVTRGDARACIDPPVASRDILGVLEETGADGRPVRTDWLTRARSFGAFVRIAGHAVLRRVRA
ncbi:MAG: S26 family signal peptidase [Polyangiaceae bacterium]